MSDQNGDKKSLMSKYGAMMKPAHLPKKPESMAFLSDGEEVLPGETFVVAGLSLIGKEGYMCPIVTILKGNKEEGLWGWTLTLGDPNGIDGPRFFKMTTEQLDMDTSETLDGVGSLFPNTIEYFFARVGDELALENADSARLDEIFAYALPHIRDAELPPPHPGDIDVEKSKGENKVSVSRRKKIIPINRDGEPLLSSGIIMIEGEAVPAALVRCFSGDRSVFGGIAITEILLTTSDGATEKTEICLLMKNDKGVRNDSPRVIFGRLCGRIGIPEHLCERHKEYLEQWHPEDSPFVVDEVVGRYYSYSYTLEEDSFVERAS